MSVRAFVDWSAQAVVSVLVDRDGRPLNARVHALERSDDGWTFHPFSAQDVRAALCDGDPLECR